MNTPASLGPEAESRPTRAPVAAPAAGGAGLREQVLSALATVYDPELDEPITSLRFITSCEVSPRGEVGVVLRLPTPQCAPNFAFLMAADARRAVRSVPGVQGVTVELEDHYTGDEINGALSRGQGFTGAFPGETDDDDLEALRDLFTRKALIARQARVCEQMLSSGATEPTWSRPPWPSCRRTTPTRSGRFSCAHSSASPRRPDAPAFIQPNGEPVALDQLDPMAARRPADPHRPGGQRRYVPFAAGLPPQP